MERPRPNLMLVPVGGEVRTPDGGRATVLYEDPSVAKRDEVQFGKVEKYESEHVVVAENLGIRAKGLTIISESEGVAELSEANGIVAATHLGDGDAHDRRVVIALGMEPSVAASLANKEKARAQDEIDEVAREAKIRRKLDGNQIRSAMKDGRDGRKVVILFQDRSGRQHSEVKTRVKGQFAEIIPLFQNVEAEIPAAA